MEMTEIAQFIGSYGFPIAVAWYLLTKIKTSIENNTTAITSLQAIIVQMCDKLNDSTKGSTKP